MLLRHHKENCFTMGRRMLLERDNMYSNIFIIDLMKFILSYNIITMPENQIYRTTTVEKLIRNKSY